MRSLLYIIILAALAGCGTVSSQRKAIDDACDMMSSDPHEAFDRLCAMDVSEFSDSATMARWALAYSEALVANNLQAPSDTIINIAVDYYSAHADKSAFLKATMLRDSIESSPATANNALLKALYVQKEREYSLYRERMTRKNLTLIAIIALLAACYVISRQRSRLRRQQARQAALMAEASALRESLSCGRQQYTDMETSLHRLLGERFDLIGRLCDTYYETRGTTVERKALTQQVVQEISSLKNDSSTFESIEQTINRCRGNLLKTLKEECPDIRPDDYTLMTYLACGFSSRTISLLTGVEIDTLYKRKSRLRSRLKAIDPPHMSEFSAIF